VAHSVNERKERECCEAMISDISCRSRRGSSLGGGGD
jgi:hypothetical protein